MSDIYAKDGVNVSVGDNFSAFAARECAKTSSSFVQVHDWAKGHFRGPRTFTFANLSGEVQFDVASDGTGTKTIVTVEAETPDQAGYDVVAMPCGDITRWGGKPILLCNVLDVSTLGDPDSKTERFFRAAIISLCRAARENGVVAYRGETAELGPCVGSENNESFAKYNWAGFAIGIYHPSRMITGETMEPGDVVVALKEDGFRSNGLSSVRAALRERFGQNYDGKWWLNPDAKAAIAAAATPSKLYDSFLSWINGWTQKGLQERICNVKCIAHLSGGGIPGKFAKDILFPLGLSAELTDLHDPAPVMRSCAQWRGMSDRQSYKTFHGGQGVLTVLPEREADIFISFAGQFNIKAKRCGVIKAGEGNPYLHVHSKFSSQRLEYTPKDEDI